MNCFGNLFNELEMFFNDVDAELWSFDDDRGEDDQQWPEDSTKTEPEAKMLVGIQTAKTANLDASAKQVD